MKSTTALRSAVSASGVIELSTLLAASHGPFVSWETKIGCNFTTRRSAYSLAKIQAGPDQCSPEPVVFSTSQGALASTPTRSAPALRMASTRGLSPGAGGSCARAGSDTASKQVAISPLVAIFMFLLPMVEHL